MFTILLVRTIKRCLIINLENNENFDQSIVCIMLPTNIFHKLQKKNPLDFVNTYTTKTIML